jgi:hypothetical protein
LGDSHAEFQQLTVDAWCTLKKIRASHLADQSASPRAIPSAHRASDHVIVAPGRPPPRHKHPEQPIDEAKTRAGRPAASALPIDAAVQRTPKTEASDMRPWRPKAISRLQFSRPLDTCVAKARVVSRGRQIISAEPWVRDGGGKVLAHGTSMLMLLNARD